MTNFSTSNMYEPFLEHLVSKMIVKSFDQHQTKPIYTYNFSVSRGLPLSNWDSEWKSMSEYEDLTFVLSKSDISKNPYVELITKNSSSVTASAYPSKEQQKVITDVLNFFESKPSADPTNRFRTLTVFGEPGTGKTFTLQLLNKSTADIAITHYCMIQHNQSRNVTSVETTTLAKFVMSALNMNIKTYSRFSDILNSTSVATLNEKTTKSKLKYKSDTFDKLFKNPLGSGVKENVLFFLDQVPPGNASMLRFIQLMLKHYLKQQQNRRVLFLICLDGDIDKDHRSISNGTYEYQNSKRNHGDQYTQFLKNFKQAPWPECIEIIHKSLVDKLDKRKITFEYPVATLQRLPLPQLKDERLVNCDGIKKWCGENLKKFQQFSFFSYTNKEAHYMNLSTFLAACEQFRDHCNNLPQDESGESLMQLLDHYQPRLASICRSDDFVDQLDQKQKSLYFLPLVIGMTYKILPILNTSRKMPKPGKIVQLLAILPRSGTTTITGNAKGSNDNNLPRLLVVDNLGIFGLVYVCYFRMNLFREKEIRGHGKLYGFPLQMVSGDTVHNSKGLTVDNELYASLGNYSPELLYLILTRTKTEDQIKGINIRE